MSFEEEIKMLTEDLKRANNLYEIMIKYFDQSPETFNKYEYARHVDLLRTFAYIVGDVESDLSMMLHRIKDDDERAV